MAGWNYAIGNVRLMKRFDSDWVVFAENDSETNFIRMGDMKVRSIVLSRKR